MRTISRLIATVFAVFSVVSSASAQSHDSFIPLSPDLPLAREMARGETHVYPIALAAGQYASLPAWSSSSAISISCCACLTPPPKAAPLGVEAPFSLTSTPAPVGGHQNRLF